MSSSTSTNTTSRVEETIRSKDGTKIFVRQWNPANEKKKAHVIVNHGYLEHGGRYRELAEYLATKHAIGTIAFDLRGHGKSGGQRAYCWTIQDYFADLEAVVEHVNHPPLKQDSTTDVKPLPLFILAHSFGGLVFLDYARDNKATSFAGAIVTCPFVDYADQLSGAKVLASKILGSLVPRLSLPVDEIPAKNLTSDAQKQKEHDDDELMLHKFTVGWALETLKAQARVRDTSPFPLSMPVLYFVSKQDKVSCPTAVAKVGDSIAQKDKTIVDRDEDEHEILNEVKRQECFQLIGEWVSNRV